MKNIFLYVCYLLLLIACRDKPAATKPIQEKPAVFSGAEEITAAVGALLPAPHSFQLKQATKWHDASGENWLVLYETGSYIQKPSTAASAQLFAILYQKTDSGFVETWKYTDGVSECELDITCSFYDNQLSVTDLDYNGVAEIIMVYALACKGDVSGNEKKLVLYEGNQKYIMQGTETVIFGKDTLEKSEVTQSALAGAPVVLQNFVKSYWNRFGTQKYD